MRLSYFPLALPSPACYAYSMEINENHMWANLTDEDMLDFDAQVKPV